ncbi:MAG: hypothetical protein GEU78_15230 [Actinobacteria bacterium]|nr:hypothetical protein [Actinomycetota bacterium]
MTASALASYALALTFAWAAVAKAVRPSAWSSSLSGYGFSGSLARVVAVAVPGVEAGVAVLSVAGLRSIGAALALALLSGFSFAILQATRTRGSRLPCGCFGGTKERDFRLMLLRNALLAVLAAVVLVGRQVRPVSVHGTVEGVPLVLSVAGAAVICWTLWQVVSSLRGRRNS